MDLVDTNLEIIVQSSNLSHDQTQVATCAAASSVFQDESRGLNELSPEDLNSLKKQVFGYALKDMWNGAEPIFNEYGDMVRIPLNDEGDTALHVAVKENSITFVEGLVNLMTPQDLQIQNSHGYTAFCMAAESGNGDFIQIMIEKNESLPLIKTADGMLPVRCAANRGNHQIVQDLSSKTLLQKMDIEDTEKLFFESIEQDMFDVAMEIFEEYPAHLAISNDDYYGKHLTTLLMLARKPLKKESYDSRASWGDGLQLLKKVWHQVTRQLKPQEILQLMSDDPTLLLFIALELGDIESVTWLLFENPELLSLESDYEQNILYYAVRHRHSSIVSCIFKIGAPNHMLLHLDKNGNNILHLAAYPFEIEETSSTLRATTKMTRDVAWFKEIEKNVPTELRTMRNYEGMMLEF